MSSLWTPDGERPVGQPTMGGDAPAQSGSVPPSGGGQPPPVNNEESAEQVEAMQRELANAPVEVVIANHCYGLFELAAVYLSQSPPLLPQARLAIDALASLVGGLKGRLGEADDHLKDGLSQLQLAYVQIDGAQRAAEQIAAGAGTNGGPDVATTGEPNPGNTGPGTEAEPGA